MIIALLNKGRMSYLRPDKIEIQSILSSLMEAKKYAKGRLLDVGCGNKPYETIFNDVVEEYIGIDLPNSSLREKSGRADVYVSGLNLPFKGESFDAILCTQVLEHVPEPKRLLDESFRVLKKGGFLILTAPMVWGLHEIPQDYYRYT